MERKWNKNTLLYIFTLLTSLIIYFKINFIIITFLSINIFIKNDFNVGLSKTQNHTILIVKEKITVRSNLLNIFYNIL
jgi:hypothetical protein